MPFIILKIIGLLFMLHQNVDARALGKGPLRKSFHFELIPFKSFSLMLEHLTPFGKFEMKHSLEKRDVIEEPILNEIIPVPVEEKKVVMTSVVVPLVEAPVPAPAPKPVIPFVIELAPKPVEVLPPPPPEPPVVEPVPPPPPELPIGPVFYTDISKIPLINFAYNKPVPVEVPEVALGPVEMPVGPPVAEEVVPVPVPVEPVVPPKPVPIVQEVIVKPILPVVVPPPAEAPVAVPPPPPPPLPNYIVKGSRLIIFFGSKLLEMLTQFIDGRTFNEFTLPQFPLTPQGKKK